MDNLPHWLSNCFNREPVQVTSLPVAPLLSGSSIHLLYGLLSLCISPKCPQTPVQYSPLQLQSLFLYLFFPYLQISLSNLDLYNHLPKGHLHSTGPLVSHTQSVPNEVITSKTCCSYSLLLSQWLIPLSSPFFHNPESGRSSLLPCTLLSPKYSYYKPQTAFQIHLMLSISTLLSSFTPPPSLDWITATVS